MVFEKQNNYLKASKYVKDIYKEASVSNESFGVNIVGESMIITLLKKMETDKLEQVRYIINNIIKERKEQIQINESVKNDK